MVADTLETHVCNEQALASITAIASSSTPCPTCSTPIQRVIGCSTMMCIACGTYFCYTTGARLPGRDHHNPHVREWAARARMMAFAANEVVDECTPDMVHSLLEQSRPAYVEMVNNAFMRYCSTQPVGSGLVEHSVFLRIGALQSMLLADSADSISACAHAPHQYEMQRLMNATSLYERARRNYDARVRHLMTGSTRAAFERQTQLAYRKHEVMAQYCGICQEFDGALLGWMRRTTRVFGSTALSMDEGADAISVAQCIDDAYAMFVQMVRFFSDRMEDVGRSYGTHMHQMAWIVDVSGVGILIRRARREAASYKRKARA
jgi:hypothetical protein